MWRHARHRQFAHCLTVLGSDARRQFPTKTPFGEAEFKRDYLKRESIAVDHTHARRPGSIGCAGVCTVCEVRFRPCVTDPPRRSSGLTDQFSGTVHTFVRCIANIGSELLEHAAVTQAAPWMAVAHQYCEVSIHGHSNRSSFTGMRNGTS